MTDFGLRERLERESHRVSLAPGASDRMFERRARRERRRRAGTAAVGLALAASVVALMISTLSGRDVERDVITDASVVAGTYETRLPSRDPDVARLGVEGFFDLTLSGEGNLELNGPWDVDLPGPPTTFAIDGDELTTDLLVGFGCESNGTYRWALDDGELTLTPFDDACELRSVLLGTRRWTAFDPGPPADALQGDWTARYTCEAMVAAVDRSASPPDAVAFWRGGIAESLGSPDPEDPCAGSPPPLSSTLRFTGDRLLIFDGRPEGFDGRYELNGDVLTIRDPRTGNITGEYQLRVEITSDTLAFKLLGEGAADPWFTGTWEVAPFVNRRVLFE
jgi:hypothetical protein